MINEEESCQTFEEEMLELFFQGEGGALLFDIPPARICKQDVAEEPAMEARSVLRWHPQQQALT
jgi:hypothetical protein